MKKAIVLPILVVGLVLLTACSSSLDGAWVLSSGQEERGCTERFTFLDGNNIEIKDTKDKSVVATYERVGPDQFKLDMQITSILVHMKVTDEKQLLMKSSDKLCMYDKVHTVK